LFKNNVVPAVNLDADTCEAANKFATLTVPVQTGGIEVIQRAVLDDSLENRPSQDLFYCILVGVVGTGTALSFLFYLLGLTNTFELGADNIILSEDELRERFKIGETNE